MQDTIQEWHAEDKGPIDGTHGCPQKNVFSVPTRASVRASVRWKDVFSHTVPLRFLVRGLTYLPPTDIPGWVHFRAFVGFVGSPEGCHDPCWAPRLAALKARRRKSHPCPRLLETRVLGPSEGKCTQGLGSVLSSVRDQ
eukprot:gene15632-biopygen8179